MRTLFLTISILIGFLTTPMLAQQSVVSPAAVYGKPQISRTVAWGIPVTIYTNAQIGVNPTRAVDQIIATPAFDLPNRLADRGVRIGQCGGGGSLFAKGGTTQPILYVDNEQITFILQPTDLPSNRQLCAEIEKYVTGTVAPFIIDRATITVSPGTIYVEEVYAYGTLRGRIANPRLQTRQSTSTQWLNAAPVVPYVGYVDIAFAVNGYAGGTVTAHYFDDFGQGFNPPNIATFQDPVTPWVTWLTYRITQTDKAMFKAPGPMWVNLSGANAPAGNGVFLPITWAAGFTPFTREASPKVVMPGRV